MSSTTLTATADAYTNSGANAGTNFGTASDLRVGNDGTANGRYNSFVTFDVHDLTGNLGAAFLTLHGSQTVGQTGLKVYDVTSNPAEGTVTWNNQPAADQIQSVAAVATSAADYKFDVLPYLQYAKANSIATVTFEVTQDTANGTPSGYADFSSREGSAAPKLVCYTNDKVETPTGDAYVDSTTPTANYGSDSTLMVGNDSGEVANAARLRPLVGATATRAVAPSSTTRRRSTGGGPSRSIGTMSTTTTSSAVPGRPTRRCTIPSAYSSSTVPTSGRATSTSTSTTGKFSGTPAMPAAARTGGRSTTRTAT